MSESVTQQMTEVPEQLEIVPVQNDRVAAPKGRRKRSKAAAADAGGARTAKDGDGRDACPTEEEVLARLAHGARYCQEVEQQLARFIGPELDTIMRLHRMIILKLSTQAEVKPELWDVLKDLMKPVMDWARLQEQQREREFAEKKYRDQVEVEKADEAKAPADAALTPETLEKIELELKLL